MKYALPGLTATVGLAALVGLLGWVGWVAFSGEVANASDETRLRAFLSAPEVDPFNLNNADFRQSPERTRFSAEIHNVAEFGTGRVIVKRTLDGLSPAMVILEAPIAIVLDPLRGTGAGHLDMDSLLGDQIPVMVAGDTVEVWNALGVLIRAGLLERRP